MQRPPELFSQRPVRSDFGRGYYKLPSYGKRKLMLLALLIGISVGLGTYWIYGSQKDQQPTEIPIIKAEGPSKRRPDHPGGIDIPHQNETVFQQIDTGATGKQPAVERLLPPPEVPQSVVAGDVETKQEKAPETTIPLSQPEKTTGVEKLDDPAVISSENKPEIVTPTSSSTATPQTETKKPEPVTKTPAKTSAKPEIGGSIPEEMFTTGQPPKGFMVQLGSFPDKQKAQVEIDKLQKKYSDTLSGVKLNLKRADLGSRGAYYRIQGGPVTDAQARSICAKLWSQKAPCIIVRQ